MSRPTTDRKGCTIILRINNETRNYLEEKAKGETLSSYVRRMIQSEKNGTENNVIQNGTEYYHRLTQNGAAYGLSGEELVEKLMDAMDAGEIVYEDGAFRAESRYNFDKFVTACEDKGVPVQKMIDKCAQMIWGM